MGCCGEKRKNWRKESISSTKSTIKDHKEPVTENHPDKIFEYTANHSLKIRGLFSGKSYFFKRKGDRKSIEYNDSFAFMGEKDLRLIIQDKNN